MTRPSTSPARRDRSRVFDAARLAVLALAVALGIMTFGPAQQVAAAAGDTSATAATTPDPTSSAATPAPSATASADATPSPASTSTAAPSPTANPDPTPTTTADPTPSDTPSPTSTDGPNPIPTDPTGPPTLPSPTPGPVPGATPNPTQGPTTAAVTSDHVVIATVTGAPSRATYLPADTPVTGAAPFQTFRVRFELTNPGDADQVLVPRLEYRKVGDPAYAPVPENATVGEPLHLEHEWVAAAGGGTAQTPDAEDIAPTDLKTCTDPAAPGVAGRHTMAKNPDDALTVPGGSCIEEELTVGLSIDATYGAGYELRLTDGGAPIAGQAPATIGLGAAPVVHLSSGQRDGASVSDTTTPATSAALFPLQPSAALGLGSAVPVSRPLVATTLDTAAPSPGIHGPYTNSSDQCAVCHSAHSSQGANLLVTSGPSSSLCLMCHDGLGASTDVKTQYALTRPPNTDATREYYSHDALSASTHTLASEEELAGVLNRHSDCADCHNSHQAQSAPESTQLADPQNPSVATGWSASGSLAGVTGVAVTNGAAGAQPTYTFLDGTIQPVTHEYQLCFKCHSGYTQLPANIPGKPSTDETDTAVEFNPNNPSFHPIEAAGTNQSAAMQASLDGTSPYKLWNFSIGGTVRCLNCHASSQTPDTADPGSDLSPHTSANRGILIRSYQDRVLETTNALYSSGDFALCYVCHAEAPFANASGPGSATATNFNLHGLHLTQLAGFGSGGTDIDTAGDGQGNALCAECHFRIHSTADKTGDQQVDGSRLVSFAPDVRADSPGGTISWTPNGTGGGSCTLTCHGYTHTDLGYGS